MFATIGVQVADKTSTPLKSLDIKTSILFADLVTYSVEVWKVKTSFSELSKFTFGEIAQDMFDTSLLPIIGSYPVNSKYPLPSVSFSNQCLVPASTKEVHSP